MSDLALNSTFSACARFIRAERLTLEHADVSNSSPFSSRFLMSNLFSIQIAFRFYKLGLH